MSSQNSAVNAEKRKFDFSNKPVFSRDRIDNVLLGKKGIDSLQIQEFKPMFYQSPMLISNERDRSDSIWKNLFKYTKGCSDDHLNKFITLNLIKKKIIQTVEANIDTEDTLLENFNVFKSYFTQTLIMPQLKSKESGRLSDNEIRILVNLISDIDFFKEIQNDIKRVSLHVLISYYKITRF